MDHPAVFRSHPWRISYRTSALHPDGRAVDILHDFYIPVLQRAVTYDRVAGYFSSSSLAAASQGFSAFVGRRGKARFIVGADLASDDVTAILEGDAKRLARRLEESAFGEESVWPPAVARGVELLGWMVAHDHLDIRVGFRVHRETGRPLPINSAADGYVHEKWALFIDAAGDKIHVSGSLNESRTALVINAENLDLHCAWRNEENAQRVVAAEASFAALWADRHPAFRVLTLPEAIRRRLIQYGERCRCPREIDDTGAMHPIPTGPGALKRLRFHLIKDAPHLPRGRYVGMETAPVEPWPHQRVVARRIVEQWPGSQLLCDEVGLGKTIEAGLAIRSLVLSGLAHKVLIAAPASLTQQWQRELSDKFLLSFARVLSGPGVRHEVLSPQPERFNSRNLFDPDLLILSTGLLSRKERRQGLPNYDLALVDEAHYARRRNPTRGLRARPDYGHLYTAIRDDLRPRARCLLLATATPMQLHPVEVADLLRLMPRVGPFQFDAGLMLNYYELVGKLRRQETPNPNEWAFLTAVIRDLKFLDPFFWHYLETATLDDRGKRVLENWLGRGRIPHRTDYRLLNRLLFAAGPLSRVMLRHTRALLEVYSREGKLGARLARRQVLPIPPIRFTEQEARAYHQLETYCKGLADIMARNADDTAQRAAVGFYLSFLRLRFASSLYAIRETLRRRRERVRWTLEHQDFTLETSEFDENDFLLGEAKEDEPEAVSAILRFRTPEDLHWEQDQLDTMLATLDDLSETSSKTQHLFQVLDQRRLDGERIRQTVIFTRFYDTLQDLLRRLRTVRWNLRLGTYSGSGGRWFDPAVERLMEAPREAIKRRFLRGEIDLLLCTDAAAEGLNLQTADLLVNFDLPWNPMKVEQRIGRIDRIGQRHDLVQVLNLCYLGSAEEEVYGRLLQRLEIVGAIVGSQQLSLLPVTAKDFEDLAQGELDAETLAIQAEQRAREAREQIERMEIPAGELYQIYTRAEQTAPVHKSPVTLDHIRQGLIFSDWLAAQGCQVHRSDHGEWLALTIPDLAGTALTTSRALLETGLPAGEQTELHFASYGDSVFDRLLAGLTEFPLPDCVHRLTVIVNGIPVVGYAVCCRLSDGGHEIRLIDDYSQLEGLVLAEDRQPSQAEIRQLESLLRQRAETVYRQSRHMPDIETVNQNVAHNQQILNRLVIAELIKARQRLRQMQPLFRDEAESIERMYGDDNNRRNPVRVNHLSGDIIAAFPPRGLPFQPALTPLENKGYVDAPPILIRAALDTAWRIADTIKRRGRPLESEQVVERLLREVGK